ncbi:MAG: UDP-GlcNAc--UDP-phosphate GlcNAc-1-phosphate transferase [Pedobacter sp.]|nr:UDP-GlcNAc--UDP-phosphate GlcNAc-1-phosphate transferase [Pedobacter sp.]MDQ8052900.1 UDP-GlcNAc--UDP-phosphate GlcNAc-1-phosphate transferase [Pedobacter sp.]
MWIALIYLFVFFIVEFGYFKLARHFNIIDKPNSRSSHHQVTIRGGGIIFSIAAITWYFVNGLSYSYFIAGLVAITCISFLDDIFTLNNKLRLAIHFTAVVLLFQQWGLFSFPWYWLALALIFVIGTINAYNFMDGINGITGAYSLLAIATLFYIHTHIIAFTSTNLLVITALALLVFNFFNFRIKAKCFAGDVGSVSIAFILIFLIGQLILVTHNFGYILLLLIYGLETSTTVFFRKIRKENIFEAHRSHFYQYLANQLKWNHLIISGLYFVVQLLLNVILVNIIDNLALLLLFIAMVSIIFLVLRFLVEGKKYLMEPHTS